MEHKKTVSIGEAARIAGVSIRKVRYWSDKGYIPEPTVSVSGDMIYRLYGEDHIERMTRIKSLQDEGYTLKMAVKKASEEEKNL